MENKTTLKKDWWSVFIAIGLGCVYGILVHFLARSSDNLTLLRIQKLLIVMSIGYVFILPVVMGVITVAFAKPKLQASWLFRIFAPIGTTLISLIFSMAIGWEGAICAVMAIVVASPLASLAGIITGVIVVRTKRNKLNGWALGFLMLTPMISSSIESQLELPKHYKKVETQIVIEAPIETVWQNIIRVPKITEDISGTFYKMGFPKPIEATLSHEGVGGVRHAVFDKGLVFIETITDWQHHKRLSFAIKADPNATPLTTLDEHVVVGGKYFDVLQGTYEIEPLPESNKVILHLSSQFRISTYFNFYAGMWGDFLMTDIQESILEVIKKRAEKSS